VGLGSSSKHSSIVSQVPRDWRQPRFADGQCREMSHTEACTESLSCKREPQTLLQSPRDCTVLPDISHIGDPGQGTKGTPKGERETKAGEGRRWCIQVWALTAETQGEG
jgi:hypothetical protein